MKGPNWEGEEIEIDGTECKCCREDLEEENKNQRKREREGKRGKYGGESAVLLLSLSRGK